MERRNDGPNCRPESGRRAQVAAVKAGGLSIGTGWYGDLSSGTWGIWKAWNDVEKFKVTATENPGLAAPSVTATTATLALSNYGGAWWLKRTTPADTTCKSKGTTATENLTTLTSGTSYTYRAYSKDSCADADEIATVTFSTP